MTEPERIANNQRQTLRFPTSAAAIEAARRMRPFLERALEDMRYRGDDRRQPELYRQTREALALLEDSDRLRRVVEALGAPDGSVTFRFPPSAAAELERFAENCTRGTYASY